MENEELKNRIEGIEESIQQVIITLVQDHRETASLLQDFIKKTDTEGVWKKQMA
jgi:hypothetical protein